MSGQRTLVFRSGAVESMRSDLTACHRELTDELDRLWSGVDTDLAGWSIVTSSRQQERDHQRQLAASLHATLDALAKVETALGRLQEAAEEAETRNIALLG